MGGRLNVLQQQPDAGGKHVLHANPVMLAMLIESYPAAHPVRINYELNEWVRQNWMRWHAPIGSN